MEGDINHLWPFLTSEPRRDLWFTLPDLVAEAWLRCE